MRIGELSRRTGFSRDAIRFYERQGLIRAEEGREKTSNYKSYPEGAVMTLEVVRDAQAAGLSIGDLSIILSQLAAEDAENFDGDAFLAAKIAEVEDRIAASERFLQTLRETRQALAIAPYNQGDS
ncbi:MAG: MerR family transcriptional regulator [Silicimonas sp.]|nr:MerR family transcriptional regulator [Silicimonas sp.]